MADDVRVRIGAEQTVSKAAQDAGRSIDDLKTKTEKNTAATKDSAKATTESTASLKAFGNVAGQVVGVVTGVVAGLAKLVTEFSECDASARQLETSLTLMGQGGGVVQDRMRGLVDEMRTLYGIDDAFLRQQLTFMSTLGLSADQMERTARVAADLAASGVMPAEQAFEALTLSYEGNLRQLGRMFPEMKKMTEEELASGAAVDFLEKRVSTMSDVMADTTAGSLKRFTAAMDELREAAGGAVSALAKPMIDALTSFVNLLVSAIEKTTEFHEILKKFEAGTPLTPQEAITKLQAEIAILRADRAKLQSQITTTELSMARAGPDAAKKATEYDRSRLDQFDIEIKARLSAIDEINRMVKDRLNNGGGGGSTGKKWSLEEWALWAEANQPGLPPGYQPEFEAPLLKSLLPGEESPTWAEPVRPAVDAALALMEASAQPWGATTGQIAQVRVANWQEIVRDPGLGATIGATPDKGPSVWERLLQGISPLLDGFAKLDSMMAVLDPLNTIFRAMMETLAPIVDGLLAPVIGALNIIGKTLAAILIPALDFLAPVIEWLAKAFVWLYNNAILPFGNFIISIVVLLKALGEVIWYIVSGQWGKLGTINIAEDMEKYKLKPIDVAALTTAGGGAGGGGKGGPSSSTTVQQVPDIYVYQTFAGPVIGAGGMAEVGRFTVEGIQAYLGTGARVQFLEAAG